MFDKIWPFLFLRIWPFLKLLMAKFGFLIFFDLATLLHLCNSETSKTKRHSLLMTSWLQFIGGGLFTLYDTQHTKDSGPHKCTCNSTHKCTCIHMPVFLPSPCCFFNIHVLIIFKFLHVKNWVHQWNLQKDYHINYLTMKATIIDTHGILQASQYNKCSTDGP